MPTKTNKKTRKKVTRNAAVRGNAKPVITLTVNQAQRLVAFAEKHGKKLTYLENKLANI